MKKFFSHKAPVFVCFQYTGDNLEEVVYFVGINNIQHNAETQELNYVLNDKGVLRPRRIELNDYLVKQIADVDTDPNTPAFVSVVDPEHFALYYEELIQPAAIS